ncbi:MAG: bacteriophage holin [candidate division Zixibacteria bacterium]|nr:bacteriophage holin [candidate division Zixibacteria bacterium]
MKLNVKAFALTSAVIWGFCLFFVTWWIIFFDGATGETLLIGKLYRGYCVSPMGSVIGLGWGLLDGLIAGALFAWLYNFFVGCTSQTTAE